MLHCRAAAKHTSRGQSAAQAVLLIHSNTIAAVGIAMASKNEIQARVVFDSLIYQLLKAKQTPVVRKATSIATISEIISGE